jgi:hypothetical protein
MTACYKIYGFTGYAGIPTTCSKFAPEARIRHSSSSPYILQGERRLKPCLSVATMAKNSVGPCIPIQRTLKIFITGDLDSKLVGFS